MHIKIAKAEFWMAGCSALSLLLGASPVAAQTGGPAEASDADSAGAAEPEILVTGTRIDRAGFEAPTPTTVVGKSELRQGGHNNVGAVLNDIPQFRATSNPSNTAGNTESGTASADLRGIGASRTLSLLNGRRFVGNDDLNSIPFPLVERVEVVTGGASAAWGSGAVAGVVNVILDDRFKGLELSAETGITSRGDGEEYRVGGTFGTEFAGGRGHIIAAGEFFDTKGIFTKNARKSVGSAGIIANPNYSPTNGEHEFIIVPDLGAANESLGGLIVDGVLAGQTFNPDGTLRPFQYGSLRNETLMSGGEGLSYDDMVALTAPMKRISAFGRIGYDLAEDIRITADVRYSKIWANYAWLPDDNVGDIAISVDNAFLSEDIRSRILAAGETGFTMGRFNTDFAFGDLHYVRESVQGTLALEGKFANGWRWDVYYSHGEYRNLNEVTRGRIALNYDQAVDSVVGPGGTPICRVALTDPTTDCVPINLFGLGAPSREAAGYVTATGYSLTKTTLDVGAFSIRGEPFALWAGPVSIAFGGEARRENIRTLKTDPVSAENGFAVVNFGPLDGGFSVKEMFGEIAAPLLKDIPVFQMLELNAAARYSDYNSAGGLWSWKIGLTNRVSDDLRLRFTRSRDIRAPAIGELYQASSVNVGSIFDPFTGDQPFVQTLYGGNPDLEAEIANTLTFGAVLSPSFVPGFSLSVDYYDIDIENAITTLDGEQIVNRCFEGNTLLCGLITRNSAGSITKINSGYVNLTTFRAKGIDIEASYDLALDRVAAKMDGTLRFRVLANYVDSLVEDDGISRVEEAGTLGDAPGVPKWRGVAGVTYQSPTTTLDLRARYTGGGKFNPALDIANNKISARTYVDVSWEQRLGSSTGPELTIFGSVSNLFDVDPPLAPNSTHFDVVGRTFQIGARMRF